ncbi:ATP-binding protein [Brevibacillus sp. NPDC058079]|uniref:ATP-binding protein n=1 Tax=Brevibacillus sp. NPDC058079 TaxID=3346330 RepID=UPI0036E15B50
MSNNMFVVGRTTPKEIVIASIERRLVLDEYLLIKDSYNGALIGEVIETKLYHKVESGTFSTETGIYQSLKDLGLNVDGKPVSVAKLKLLDEITTPVTTHSAVTTPSFDDIEDLLIPTPPNKGLVLGIIRGTEKIQDLLPDYLRNLSPLYERGIGILDQKGVPFILPHYQLREYPHLGYFGGTGSGKTYGLRVGCEEIMRHSIPAVAFDPHNELEFNQPTDGLAEEHMEDFSSKHEIFNIGENVGINFTELNTEELLYLLEFIGDLTMPMRGAMEALHQKNDSFTTLYKRLTDLKKAFEIQELSKHERDQVTLPDEIVKLYERLKDKVSGLPTLQALSWRLDQLHKTGIFNHDISKVEACMLKRKMAIIRGKVSQLKMIASYITRRLYGKRRAYRDWRKNEQGVDQPPKFPPFFSITDESHIFAPDGERMNPIKAILREVSQEGRKYGVFLALGTQRPALLDKTIASQLNTKFIFRTGIESDMKMIQTETNLSAEQVSRLPDLPTGNAFVSSATLKKTFYIRFRTTKTASPHAGHPFDELDEFGEVDTKTKNVLMSFLPLSIDTINRKHSDINKALGRMIPNYEIMDVLEAMVKLKEVEKEESPFGTRYKLKN